MSNNELKLYTTELCAHVPVYDIDGDIVDQQKVALCATETELAHSLLVNIVHNEASKVLLVGISDDNELADVALLWNFQQIFSVYRATVDLGEDHSSQALAKEDRYRLLCLPHTSDAFAGQLEAWNHDMSVYHVMAPDAVCRSFVESLLRSRSHDEATQGFMVRLNGEAVSRCLIVSFQSCSVHLGGC